VPVTLAVEHTHLHDIGVGAGGGALGLADQVGLGVVTAEALVARAQPAVALRCRKTQAVALVAREVPLAGGGRGREDDQLAPLPAPGAAVLQTPGVVDTRLGKVWNREGAVRVKGVRGQGLGHRHRARRAEASVFNLPGTSDVSCSVVCCNGNFH